MKSPFLLLLLFSASTLLAQPDSGTAAAGDPVASVQSGDWMDIATWDCDCIPTESSEVAIQAGHEIQLETGQTAMAASLVIAETGRLNFPEGARVELGVSLASVGEILGQGVIAFVGEEPKSCGPATLENLACEAGTMTVTDTLTVGGELALSSVELFTEGKLILVGESGFTANAQSVIHGKVNRMRAWDKQSEFNPVVGTGLTGVLASDFLGLPGAVYLKEWMEPNTAYVELTSEDSLTQGKGFNYSLPAGMYDLSLVGDPCLQAELDITVDGSSSSWSGWNLISNPLTGFVDLNTVPLTGANSMGPAYFWDDSLETWVACVGGLGQFGRKGIVAPGEAFFLTVQDPFTMNFQPSNMVSRTEWEEQDERHDNTTMNLQLVSGERVEQCVIGLGSGAEAFDPYEDAVYIPAFRGRNNLDIYSKSTDDVSLMVNQTSSELEVIPIWVRALNGDSVTISAPTIPSTTCFTLEDVQTGWTGTIDEALSYSFAVTTHLDHHRFNLTVGGGMEAIASDAACASALDGSIMVTGPSMGSTFSIEDVNGDAVGSFTASEDGGTFTGLPVGSYTITSMSEGCANLQRTVEVGAGGTGNSPFTIDATPDHIGCYDDHGGVALEIEGGLAPYTVTWSHGDTGESIEVEAAGTLEAVITDAAGCSDSTSVEVLAAPHVQAGIEVANPVLTLIDGEAEVHFENTSTGATGYQWNFGDGATSIAENPLHAYTAVGAFTVGLNAWNDYCSDTYQVVVTVETVSAVGDLAGAMDASIERTTQGWSITHTGEAFEVEVFDLTGRLILTSNGMPGLPAMLDVAAMPPVALVHWRGLQTGQQGTWRVAR